MADKIQFLEDLIMVNLPVKSLVRFRCISKFWHNLINSPTFIDNHFHKRQNRSNIVLVRRYLPSPKDDDVMCFCNVNSPELEEVLPSLSIPFLKDLKYNYDQSYFPENVHLLGPCKGLVCIACDECIIFCNPALREFKQLPKCPFTCPENHDEDILGVGFGNSSTNDFKVVLIRSINHERYYAEGYHIIVHLYNSSTDSWREVELNEATKTTYLAHFPCSEVFFNGICHWNAQTSLLQNFEDTILSFDVGSEDVTHLGYPDCLKVLDKNLTCLTVLHECLVLLRYEAQMTEPCLMEVWMMKEYGVKESWTKELVVGPYLVICPLLSWRHGEWLLVETDNGQLASCSLRTNETKRFQVFGAEETLRALNDVESLITLNKLTQGKPPREETSATN